MCVVGQLEFSYSNISYTYMFLTKIQCVYWGLTKVSNANTIKYLPVYLNILHLSPYLLTIVSLSALFIFLLEIILWILAPQCKNVSSGHLKTLNRLLSSVLLNMGFVTSLSWKNLNCFHFKTVSHSIKSRGFLHGYFFPSPWKFSPAPWKTWKFKTVFTLRNKNNATYRSNCEDNYMK